MTKKIKIFEALLNGEWKSWQASATTEITKTRNKIVIKTKVNTEAFKGNLTTEFDLSKLIAYSIGT